MTQYDNNLYIIFLLPSVIRSYALDFMTRCFCTLQRNCWLITVYHVAKG